MYEEACTANDPVNHPQHYLAQGIFCKCQQEIECIDVARNFNFNLGNAIKYIWRSEHKGNQVQDLQKAIWYLKDQIRQLEARIEKSLADSLHCDIG